MLESNLNLLNINNYNLSTGFCHQTYKKGGVCICIFKSPAGNFYQFLKLLDIMLTSLYHPKTEFIICGDINVDYLLAKSRKQQLSHLLDSYNMSHLVNFPTRSEQNHTSAIDNVFVNNA
jgi:endonuclease/exonuclease/phosphatase family metal-dependent hydrolase